MPTIKVEYYRSKLLSNGEHPIRITVTHKGIPKGKSVASCLPDDWDEKNKKIYARRRKDANRVNRDISDAYDKYKVTFKLLRDSGRPWKSEDVFTFEHNVEGEEKKTFWDIAKEYCDLQKKVSGWTYLTFDTIVRKFRKAVGRETLLLSEIDSVIVKRFIDYCEARGNKSSTINNNLKVLRFISKYGSDQRYDTKPEDLHNFRLPPKKKGVKRKISKDKIDSFGSSDLTPRETEVLDMWLLQFYCRGMRISDVLQLKEEYIRDGYIIYDSQKNEKNFNIKLTKEAKMIVEKYIDGSEYLFSLFKFRNNALLDEGDNNVARATYIKNVTVKINKALKSMARKSGIDVKISTHIARHSFAKYALDKMRGLNLDNPTDVSMGLLGHSSLAVHEAYVKEVLADDDLNNAADKIFD